MPRKTKSKQRLDKYYNLAKDQGYRSRAAFKLFQLNKKFNFLNNATVVVDLCAAPGGWMQVCAQVMPMGSTIIGVDLVSIKGIPGCKSYQMDITTPQCVQLLKKSLPKAADVFLNDGAPNVGASWAKDAYNQNDLVLSALKLASQFLKKGGTFVTKVFRSGDYNSLIWVFNKFFGKVEATKPLASRFVSAEIFVVCSDYTAPEYIDDKLFDSKHVFKDTETDIQAQQMQKEITSVDKIIAHRGHRHRGGYADDVHQTVYGSVAFEDFINSTNPYPYFLECSKITLSQEEKDKYLALAKPPNDWQNLIDDIKVIGKREIIQLLKWRSKIKHTFDKSTKGQAEVEEWDEEEVDEVEDEEEEDQEPQNDDDFDNLAQKQQELLDKKSVTLLKSELQEQRKLRTKRLNQEKKLVGQGVKIGFENTDEELFSFHKHKGIQKLGYVELEPEQTEPRVRNALKFKGQEELDKNLEMLYEDKKARREAGTEKARQKRQARKRRDSDQQEEYDEDQLKCKPVKHLKGENKEFTQVPNEKLKSRDLEGQFFDREIFDGLKQQLNEQSTFNNPLKGKKIMSKDEEKKPKPEKKRDQKPKKITEEDEEQLEAKEKQRGMNYIQRQVQSELQELYADDDYIESGNSESEFEKRINMKIVQEEIPNEEEKVKMYELKVPLSEMEKRRKKLKRQAQKEDKKKKIAQDDDPNNTNKEFEVVPAKKLEDYDIDELATNLALAKKMLRKKTRESIIDNSYKRDAYDDYEELPKWFQDDEYRHVFKTEPITKEEYLTEKQRLMDINARVPKKVMEAKIRKYKKTQKKMKKAASKAQQIFETEGLNEKTKMQQVNRLYKREMSSLNRETNKKYIVAKRSTASGKGSNSKTSVFVDKRLKKDKRAQKAIDKKIGKGKLKRHVSRRSSKKQRS